MAKDNQVCFHRGLFANPVKPQRCTTEPVGPLDGINKDVSGAKLYPMAVLAYPVDCYCLCHLLNTQYCCLCLNSSLNPPSASHPSLPPLTPSHPPIPLHATCDITVAVKKVVQNSAVLAS